MFQHIVEHLLHQAGLARSADAGNHSHGVERNVDGEVFEVVAVGPFDMYAVAPAPTARWYGNVYRAVEILQRERFLYVRGGDFLLGEPLLPDTLVTMASEDHLAAETASQRSDVDDVVGGADYLLVVLHHDDGVAYVAQVFQHTNELVCVATVKSDGGFVEDVHRAHQRAAERGREVDALRLAAREGVRQAAQGEVAETDFHKVADAVAQLDEYAVCDFLFVVGELQVVEPSLQVVHLHVGELSDALAAHLDVVGVFPQPAPVTVGTDGLAAIAGHEHPVLYLVALALDPLEEAVDTLPVAFAVPEDIFLLLRELAVGGVYGKSDLGRLLYQEGAPLLHLLSPPAYYGVVVDGERRVGDDYVLVDADDAAVTLTGGTGPVGVVEAEEVGVGLFEGDAVGFETVGEASFGRVAAHHAFSSALEESCLHRFGHTCSQAVIVMVHLDAVHQQHYVAVRSLLAGARIQVVFNLYYRAGDGDTHEAFLMEYFELRFQRPLLGYLQRGVDHRPVAVRQLADVVGDVAHRVPLHLHARDGGEGATDAGKEQLEILVYLCAGAHCRARVAAVHPLLYGDGRRDVFDVVHLRFGHPAHKLAGVAAEALYIAALTFGIQSVEGQARFAAAAQTCDDDELTSRYVDVDVLQVVAASAAYFYAVVVQSCNSFPSEPSTSVILCL